LYAIPSAHTLPPCTTISGLQASKRTSVKATTVVSGGSTHTHFLCLQHIPCADCHPAPRSPGSRAQTRLASGRLSWCPVAVWVHISFVCNPLRALTATLHHDLRVPRPLQLANSAWCPMAEFIPTPFVCNTFHAQTATLHHAQSLFPLLNARIWVATTQSDSMLANTRPTGSVVFSGRPRGARLQHAWCSVVVSRGVRW
jgi:hypothetical protein